LSVTAQFRNNSTFEAFPGGQVGAALVNNSGDIVKVIGVINYSAQGAGISRSTITTINSLVPDTVASGQYKLKIVVRPTNGEWKLVERSVIRDGIPNSINFTVQ
jgi:hypothetical protein